MCTPLAMRGPNFHPVDDPFQSRIASIGIMVNVKQSLDHLTVTPRSQSQGDFDYEVQIAYHRVQSPDLCFAFNYLNSASGCIPSGISSALVYAD